MSTSVPITTNAVTVTDNGSTVAVSVASSAVSVNAGVAGPQGAVGPGVAAGGSTGQVLVKASGTDYDTSWTSNPTFGTATMTLGTATTLQAGTATLAAASIGSVSNAEIQYLDGLTEPLSVSLAGKAATADFPNTAWAAYTPTLGGTGWAIGDGTIVGVYVKLGKTVHFRVNITFGSTSTYGASSSARVSLPLAAANTIITNASALFVDVSAGAVHFGSAHRPVDANTVYVQTVGTLGVLAGTTSGNPFAWTSSDQMRISGTYETSA